VIAFDSTPSGRARRVFALLLLLLGALVARTGWLQVVCGDEYAARALRQHFTEVKTAATRGRILDRRARPLATCYHACSVTVDPAEVDDVPAFAARVALALGEPTATSDLTLRIAEAKAAGRRFLYLRRRVDREIGARVREAKLPALFVIEEPRREYPHGTAAGAVVGVVRDSEGRLVGQTGLEARFDDLLRGVEGHHTVFRTARRQRIVLHPEQRVDPIPGGDLVTTLDIGIQQLAERALDDLQEEWSPEWSCAVAIDPWSGELLAVAGRPLFEKEHFDPKSLIVPAAEYTYEPGSTIKPLVAAWALTRGAVRTDEIFDCGPGWRRFGNRVLHDVHAYGPLDLQGILVKSSNCGIAQVGQRIGMEGLHELLTRVGFGARTGVELKLETTGSFLPLRQWKPNYTDVSVSMGHAVTVSALQLLRAYSSLINGGRLVRPTLLRNGIAEEPPRVPFSAAGRRFAIETMEKVVEEGTGRRARIKGVRVGGKTGTSDGYGDEKDEVTSSFLAFAPLEAPRLIVLVVAHHPHSQKGTRPYGGTVAAPAVRSILAGALPLLEPRPRSPFDPSPLTSPESGVRPPVLNTGKVRVAAVKDSSVSVGERISPATGRNPDSADVDFESCRSGGATWRR